MSLLSKLDGWGNIISGLAGRGDKLTKSTFKSTRILHRTEIAEIMSGDGIGARIVKCVPNDMTRNGWTFTGDEDGKLYKALKDLKATSQLTRAMVWARAFGGALVMMDIADGKPIDQPYDPKSKAPVRGLKVFSSARTIITSTDFSTDPQSPYFEDLERFTIQRLYAEPFQVHASRCLVFKGEPLPDIPEQLGFDLETRYWGLSVLQQVALYLAAFGTFYGSLGHLGQEMTIGKYTISNLDNLVAANDWKSIKNRLRIIDEQKSVIHAVLLGKEEKYERDSLTFTGIPEVLDRMMVAISAATGIPVTKFWGRSSAGMNATGEGDSRDYYDMIRADQGNYLEPPLLKLAQTVNLGIGSPANPDELAVEFDPVWSPTAAEQATIQKTVMDTDVGYVNAGILDPEQVFNNRFKNGYTPLYQIDGDFIESDDTDPEMIAQLAALQAKNGTPPAPNDPTQKPPAKKAPAKAPAPGEE